MNILDNDYPVVARVASIRATRAFCLDPKHMEAVQYVYHMLPALQKYKSHYEVEQTLTKTLSEFGATFTIVDTEGVLSTFDDEAYVCILLDTVHKVTLQ